MARDRGRLGNNHHPRKGPAEQQRDHGVKDRTSQHFAPGEPLRLCFRLLHHAVRHKIRRTLPADKAPGHDGSPTDRPENNERCGNADRANQSLGNRRHKHRTHAVGRRHDTPCHAASVRKITYSGSNAGPIGQPQPQTEKTAIRRDQSSHGFRESAADQSEPHKETACHNDGPGAESVIDRTAQNHRNRSHRIRDPERDSEVSRGNRSAEHR